MTRQNHQEITEPVDPGGRVAVSSLAAGGRRTGHPSRQIYLAAVVMLGMFVIAWSAVDTVTHPPSVIVWVLVVLTLVTGWLMVRMPGFPVSFSLSDTFTITGALLLGPAVGTLLVALDGLVISTRLTPANRTVTRVLFNAAAPALAMWLSARTFFALAHGPIPGGTADASRLVMLLAVFATMYFVLNTWFVAGAVTVGRDVPVATTWREHFLPLWITFYSGTSVAGLLLILNNAGLANLRTLILAMPVLLVLYTAFGTVIGRLRQRSADFEKLRSYAAALRSTTDAVVLTDTADRVTFMNPMAERLTGWPEEHAAGRPVGDVFRLRGVTSSDIGLPDEPLADEGATREHVLVRVDGSTCVIEDTRAYIRDEDGTISGVIRTFRDISRRKAVEAERQFLLRSEQAARAAADAANRSKEEFLATLSHELRTPATAIIGWTHLLKGGRLDDERARKALAALERNASAQAAVLEDLLDMSRIVRGVMRLDIRRTRLAEVVEEAMAAVEPAVEAKGLQIHVDLPADPVILDADPDRLRQVLWNLLANAVKFTPEGGSIHVSAMREGDFVRVDVIDTGAGIEPEFLGLVFDRFRQADSSSTREHGGLGLGLAIVRDLVEMHGGRVEAASDGRGHGARFTIFLPGAIRQRAGDEELTQGRLL